MPPSPGSPTAAAAAATRTPESLLEELNLMLNTLSPTAREEFVEKVQQLLPPAPALSIAPLTLKMLGIPESTAVDVNRLAPCLSALIEFLVKMDDTAWGVWKGFGADSKSLKRDVQMRPLLKALLRGNSKLTVKQVEYQIANLMRLSVELLGQATKVAGHATQFLRKFRPDRIQAEAEAQRSKLSLSSVESECWEVYTQKWSQTIEPGFQRAVSKEIARNVAMTVKIQRLPV